MRVRRSWRALNVPMRARLSSTMRVYSEGHESRHEEEDERNTAAMLVHAVGVRLEVRCTVVRRGP